MDLTSDIPCCPVEYTLSIIGGKYKPLILWHLQKGALRFSELRKRVPHATPKMLIQHLRELEADGLVIRTIYPVIPPRVEYRLDEHGRSMLPVLQAMCDWGMASRPAQTKRRTAPQTATSA